MQEPPTMESKGMLIQQMKVSNLVGTCDFIHSPVYLLHERIVLGLERFRKGSVVGYFHHSEKTPNELHVLQNGSSSLKSMLRH